jgi:hypothetical protein
LCYIRASGTTLHWVFKQTVSQTPILPITAPVLPSLSYLTCKDLFLALVESQFESIKRPTRPSFGARLPSTGCRPLDSFPDWAISNFTLHAPSFNTGIILNLPLFALCKSLLRLCYSSIVKILTFLRISFDHSTRFDLLWSFHSLLSSIGRDNCVATAELRRFSLDTSPKCAPIMLLWCWWRFSPPR